MQIDNYGMEYNGDSGNTTPPTLSLSVGNIGENMKTSNTRSTPRAVARITVTFQPTPAAQTLLNVAERANLNRSELMNSLIEKHLPSLLREQVSAIEEALASLKRV